MRCVDRETDVLIIGTGGAGLRAAIEAAAQNVRVLVVSKMERDESNCTIAAWGGLTYAPEELRTELFRQVVETGGYLNDQRLVETFARETPDRIAELFRMNLEIDILEEADVRKKLGMVKLRGRGRTTGLGLTRRLREQAEAMGVAFMDRMMIVELVLDESGVCGAIGVSLDDGGLIAISARAVIIATGGGACLYERNDNPPGATADGMALAYAAGAELVDMECVSFQFPEQRLRELFQIGTAPDEKLLSTGTAHYFLGGIGIDGHARTNVPGLYAAGEVTGGLFGAARLGGSAMADTLVFGCIAGREAARSAKEVSSRPVPVARQETVARCLADMLSVSAANVAEVSNSLKKIMWRYCGTMKTGETLTRALNELAALPSQARISSPADLRAGLEYANMRTVGRLVASASLLRKETKGCFWRLDFPEPDNEHWLGNIVQSRQQGEDRQTVRPAVMTTLTRPGRPRIGAGCFPYLR